MCASACVHVCVCSCVCVCVCVHVCVFVYALRIVSMDKILHIINTFSIIKTHSFLLTLCMIAGGHGYKGTLPFSEQPFETWLYSYL